MPMDSTCAAGAGGGPGQNAGCKRFLFMDLQRRTMRHRLSHEGRSEDRCGDNHNRVWADGKLKVSVRVSRLCQALQQGDGHAA